MKREYYADSISNFLRASTEEIIGRTISILPSQLALRMAST